MRCFFLLVVLVSVLLPPLAVALVLVVVVAVREAALDERVLLVDVSTEDDANTEPHGRVVVVG